MVLKAKQPCRVEAFEERSILVKVKPPASRAYAPEGKADISTIGI